MLQSLEIENFRQFSHFTIPKLGRINLLTGKNNSGKTSVLEAIYLLTAKGNPMREIYRIQKVRGELIQSQDRDRGETVDIRHLFHQRLINIGSSLKISGITPFQEDCFFEIELIKDSRQTENGGSDPQSNNQSTDEFIDYAPTKLLIKSKDQEKTYDLTSEMGVYLRNSYPMSRSLENQSATDNFLLSTGLNSYEIFELFERVVLEPEEDLVIDSLKLIEPNISRIAPVSLPRYRSGREGFFVSLSGYERRVPLSSMGDGVWRLLEIALVMVNAKDKPLLIDEVDTGLHYSVMVDLWKLIWKTAKKLDVQVFATTHSRDCWEALAELVEQENATSEEIMLHHISAPKGQSISFTGNQLSIASERDLEVR